MVGAHAATYPGLVRAEVKAGDEVGSHTYTHQNLVSAGWQLPLQLTLTQNAVAGAAGIRTNLLRPPYCGGPDALTASDWQAYRRAAKLGYLIVLDTVDTRDWARPGVRRIIANALRWPRGAQSAIIMMHDSGGNRGQTVRALPAIISRLRAEHYRFVTVTAGLRLPAADVPATARQRIFGTGLVLSQQIADHSVAVLAVILVIASVLLVLRILALMGFARLHRRRSRQWLLEYRARSRRRTWPALAISVVIPAFNEAAGIEATVRSMASSRYPSDVEMIVVDDGSTDDTASIVRGLRLPGVRVISQRNAGQTRRPQPRHRPSPPRHPRPSRR